MEKLKTLMAASKNPPINFLFNCLNLLRSTPEDQAEKKSRL